MSAPRWARALLARLAGPWRADEVVGDLEEAHRSRVERHGRLVAVILTAVDTVDMALALVRLRRAPAPGSGRPDRAGRVLQRRRSWLISWLDIKLGLRMMVKHPGLTVVSVLGLAVAVGIGASVFGVINGMTSSPLPLDEGDRVVTIQNVSAFGFEQARSTHLHHLASWREVTAFGELGAYRIVKRNLITAEGGVAPARVVEMTASGFRIARVPPLLGRPLIEADEEEGAPPVVVIGYGVWQDRFAGREDILGQSIDIGGTRHEIVGVMPRGFAFPINNRVWRPLKLDPSNYSIGEAPPIDVFGRLAPGASIDEASAQLKVIGQRAAAANPQAYRGLRPRVFPYTQELVWGPMSWVLHLVQLFVSMLLVTIAINVAALVYARTTTRAGEIAIRTALGAGRGRIASQLFAESFLLSASAAALGLWVARSVTGRIELYVRSSGGEQIPFWWDFGLSPVALVYVLGLALLAAVIIGVVPLLGSTGRRLRSGLQRLGSSTSGVGLGRIWTALIVAQIAVAVAVLPVALSWSWRWGLLETLTDSGFPLDQVLIARLEFDAEPGGSPSAGDAAQGERLASLRAELVRRFEAEGKISGVAAMPMPPWEDPDLPFEIDGTARSPLATPIQSASTGHRVGRSVVAPEFFETFDIPILSGRGLVASDASSEAPPVVVNHTFVDLVLGGSNPLGRRIRFMSGASQSEGGTASGPWHTIVGVVPNFLPSAMSNPEAKAFLPASGVEPRPVTLAIRVRGGETAGFGGRLRQIAAEVDPMLRIEGLESLAMMLDRDRAASRLLIVTIGVLCLAVLLLAIAGLYALMSFTIARRRREIGIRTALGAQPYRVLRSVLGRAASQLALGIVVGLALAVLVDRLAGGEMIGGREVVFLPLVVVVMGLVGLLAAWGPARRGLRIQPTEALRME